MESGCIRVMCVDDHPVVREGLRSVLSREPDINVIAIAENGEEAVRLFQDHLPDVTILDLRMPGMGGLRAVEQIRGKFPRANIILLTTYDGDEDIYQAVRAGAATYLLKDSVADDLVRVVREVHRGGRPLPPTVAARLADRIGKPTLTRREVEVLNLISRGLRNKEIAGELDISEETVQVHVKNILAKLSVHDRTEAVTVALRRGILHLD